MSLLYSIDGKKIDIAQQALRNLDRALAIDGTPVKHGLKWIANSAERYASSVTHLDTWTLWESYLVHQSVGTSGAFATVYVDPSVINPRGQRPAIYAEYEFARGGGHDAFQITVGVSDSYVNPGIDLIINEAMRELN